MKKCPNCSANVSDSAKFCNHCGFNIKKSEEYKNQVVKVCPQCGTIFSDGHFCPECGYDINKIREDIKISDDFEIKDGVLIKYKGKSSFCIVPDIVVAIGKSAFEGTQIEGIKLPKNLLHIGEYAFECHELQNIILPDNLQFICKYAFKYCKFRNIIIPRSVIDIGDHIFYWCNNLTKIKAPRHLAEQLKKYKDILELY